MFSAPTDVGGRYSALCEFGLVPAALIGVDVGRLLTSVQSLARDASDEELEQALRLGATIGECALAGRNKLTFVTSPSLRSLPAWIEQLIAESTGKLGVGIVSQWISEPVVGLRPQLTATTALMIYHRI